MTGRIRIIQQIEDTTRSGEDFARRDTCRSSNIRMALVQDDGSAGKYNLNKRTRGERRTCSQVYRRQRCEQVHVDDAAGQRVPELRREGLRESHEETIDFHSTLR